MVMRAAWFVLALMAAAVGALHGVLVVRAETIADGLAHLVLAVYCAGLIWYVARRQEPQE